VAASVGLGVGVRVMEIPDDPSRGAETEFEIEQIPRFEDNLAGQEYRRAGSLLHEAIFGPGAFNEQLARRVVTTPTFAAYDPDPLVRLPKPLATLLDGTLEHGWRASEENDRLLTSAFRTRWDESVEAAARFPLGTIEDPRDLTLNSPMRHMHSLNAADALLLVRGLKAQHDGDSERFVTDFALVLNLSRNLRNKSVQGCAVAGRRVEQRAVQALQRWLENLRGRDDLLARIDRLLAEHDARFGDDSADIRLADQVVLRNSLQRSGEVLRRQWRHTDAPEDSRTRMDAEADLVGLAWQMPWEKERHERILAHGNVTGYGYGPPANPSPFGGLPGVGLIPHALSQWYTSKGGFAQVEGLVQADRRAGRTLLALRRYELKYSRPPETLSALVPEFLPGVPTDPFSNRPFGYRLSAGEEVEVETHTPPPFAALSEFGRRFVLLAGGVTVVDGANVSLSTTTSDVRWMKTISPGQPVLWSAGIDRVDNGGVKLATRFAGGDLLYLPSPRPVETR
jgi:hypothetical protein